MAKIATRGIFIKRKVKTVTEDAKTGKVTEKTEVKTFPCKVNASVPFNHRMCI